MTLNEALEKCSDRWGEGLPLTFSYQNCEIDDLWQMLTELKRLEKEQTSWIPVSERLPEELEAVNITWVNHNPEGYYANIKDKPFTATGVYFNGQWYWWSTMCSDIIAEYSHNYDDIIDDAIEIVAWMPMPEPYRVESEDKECI